MTLHALATPSLDAGDHARPASPTPRPSREFRTTFKGLPNGDTNRSQSTTYIKHTGFNKLAPVYCVCYLVLWRSYPLNSESLLPSSPAPRPSSFPAVHQHVYFHASIPLVPTPHLAPRCPADASSAKTNEVFLSTDSSSPTSRSRILVNSLCLCPLVKSSFTSRDSVPVVPTPFRSGQKYKMILTDLCQVF